MSDRCINYYYPEGRATLYHCRQYLGWFYLAGFKPNGSYHKKRKKVSSELIELYIGYVML